MKNEQERIPRMSYTPEYVVKKKIPKKEPGKFRNIYIPSDEYKEYQRNILIPPLEKQISPCLSENTFAYRKGVSIIHVVDKLEDLMLHGYKWVIKLDIRKYFDSIDRGILYDQLESVISPECLQDIKMHLEVPYKYGGKLYTFKKGIYQGVPISSLLSNLYLTDLDESFQGQSKVYSLRYCDDILLLSTSKPKLKKAFTKMKKILREKKLAWEASAISNLEIESMTFLGLLFRKEGNTLQVRASRRAEYKLLEILSEAKTIEKLRDAIYSRVWYYTVGFRHLDYLEVAKDLVTQLKGVDIWDQIITTGRVSSETSFMDVYEVDNLRS